MTKNTAKKRLSGKSTDNAEETLDDTKIPLTAHLEELRKRLITCLIAVGIGFLCCYGFKETLFQILTQPLVAVMKEGQSLIYTGLAEAFITYLKAAFIGGLILAAPVIIYQFWMFVAPGLYEREKRLVFPVVCLSSVFFVGGALFGYFAVFPVGFEFFLSFASETIRPMPTMKEYLGLSSKLLLAFGLVFELPLMVVFLAKLGVVTVPFLTKNRKYVVVLAFIVGAILTPPDVVSQVMMAVPMLILYEVGVIGARIATRKKDAEATDAAPDDDTSPADEG